MLLLSRWYLELMKEFRSVYQVVIILDSLVILGLTALVVVQPRFQALLPLAGLLAGLNAALHSRTLRLNPGLKRLLLVGGLLSVLLMAVVSVTRFMR